MKNIDRDKVIVVDDFVNISDSLKVYGNGPLMQFDISFKSKIMRKNIISALSSIPNMLGYEKHYFPKKHHFINRNSGDFILVSEPGWLIFTRDQLKKMQDDRFGLISRLEFFLTYFPSRSNGKAMSQSGHMH